MDYAVIGQKIRSHRKEKQMTQEVLAEAANVSASF